LTPLQLTTLDPVSLLPEVSPEGPHTNVYQEQTFLDVIASFPIVGNLVAGILSLADPSGSFGDKVATLGWQLGAEWSN